jgi:cytochrome c oxidase assembly protein subunit 15
VRSLNGTARACYMRPMTAAPVPARRPAHRAIAIWLFAVAAMVFAMVVIGGVTRLTESGLSIVEWKPIAGTLPPLSDAAWQAEFDKYKQFPEYQKINRGMTLAEFKQIFFWEWLHRLWGRLIGVAFFLPFVWFLATRRVPPGLGPTLWGLLVLGGAQGALGWFMVMSGLVDRPSVSQYRLAAHLGLAVLIYAALMWVGWGQWQAAKGLRPDPGAGARLRGAAHALVPWVFLVILSGGFVAGLDAGLAYNTFPLMDGRWIPAGAWSLDPGWLNIFENTITVQFQHRVLAMLTVVGVALVWWRARTLAVPGWLASRTHLLAAAVLLQASIGILTLIHVVPIPLAAAHQAGAMLLLTAALYFLHGLRRPR